jgi:hypothetical protein
MPNRDDELNERTFKGTDTTEQRVYYTLHAPMMKDPPRPIPGEWTRDDRSQAHRTASVLSQLIEHLEKKGLLAEEELDEILLNATR